MSRLEAHRGLRSSPQDAPKLRILHFQPPGSCLAPLLHAELYKQWIPMIPLSEPICDPSPFRKLAYLKAQSMVGR